MTQQELADSLPEWSRGKVSQYAMIERKQDPKTKTWQGLAKQAWEIVATTFQENRSNSKNGSVANNATSVANLFTEYLLRDILSLKPCRQIELVQELIATTFQENGSNGKNGMVADNATTVANLFSERLKI